MILIEFSPGLLTDLLAEGKTYSRRTIIEGLPPDVTFVKAELEPDGFGSLIGRVYFNDGKDETTQVRLTVQCHDGPVIEGLKDAVAVEEDEVVCWRGILLTFNGPIDEVFALSAIKDANKIGE